MRYSHLALLLLALASADAMAEWNKFGTLSEASVYIDRASIQRHAGVARMWDLFDFRSAQEVDGKNYLSLKSLAEYDCAEQRTRPLRIIAFTRNMGNGSVASSMESAGPWENIVPSTMEESLWRQACSRG